MFLVVVIALISPLFASEYKNLLEFPDSFYELPEQIQKDILLKSYISKKEIREKGAINFINAIENEFDHKLTDREKYSLLGFEWQEMSFKALNSHKTIYGRDCKSMNLSEDINLNIIFSDFKCNDSMISDSECLNTIYVSAETVSLIPQAVNVICSQYFSGTNSDNLDQTIESSGSSYFFVDRGLGYGVILIHPEYDFNKPKGNPQCFIERKPTCLKPLKN
jgi:hypothetical protein